MIGKRQTTNAAQILAGLLLLSLTVAGVSRAALPGSSGKMKKHSVPVLLEALLAVPKNVDDGLPEFWAVNFHMSRQDRDRAVFFHGIKERFHWFFPASKDRSHLRMGMDDGIRLFEFKKIGRASCRERV